MNADMVVQAFGPAAGVVIIALAGVVVYLYRSKEAAVKELRKSYDDLQEKRYQEALETQDRLVKLVEEQKELPERVYNFAVRNKDGK
jgi:hypothetical protein